jgi:fructooligosaccharide transport system permease protein
MSNSHKAKIAKTIISTILITLLALLFLFPLVWMIASSMKSESAIYHDLSSYRAFLPAFDINQWGKAYSSLLARFNVFIYILNSLFYGLSVTAGSVIVNSLAGYGFSKFRFKGRRFLFGLLLAMLVIPVKRLLFRNSKLLVG